eukprot:3947825-Heterocapsa_arctica.AAC.1
MSLHRAFRVTEVIACSAISRMSAMSRMFRPGPSPVAAAGARHGAEGSGSAGIPDGDSTPVTWSCTPV